MCATDLVKPASSCEQSVLSNQNITLQKVCQIMKDEGIIIEENHIHKFALSLNRKSFKQVLNETYQERKVGICCFMTFCGFVIPGLILCIYIFYKTYQENKVYNCVYKPSIPTQLMNNLTGHSSPLGTNDNLLSLYKRNLQPLSLQEFGDYVHDSLFINNTCATKQYEEYKKKVKANKVLIEKARDRVV